jgi:hypothetical protein
VAKKGAKGPNALWIPAKSCSFTIFWWLPKGVLVSANFASANPKICFLLQAGYYLSFHTAPRFNVDQEKNIKTHTAAPDGTYHARRAREQNRFCLRFS